MAKTTKVLSWYLVDRLEAVRIAEGMKIEEFADHFEISRIAYYQWRNKTINKKPINIPLATVERGLRSLGYDAHIIITKRIDDENPV